MEKIEAYKNRTEYDKRLAELGLTRGSGGMMIDPDEFDASDIEAELTAASAAGIDIGRCFYVVYPNRSR